jgi:hypothetical protein
VKPIVVDGSTSAVAWTKAARLVLRDGPLHHVIINIARPLKTSELNASQYDPRTIKRTVSGLSDVANTIFPPQTKRWKDRLKFYEHYRRIYERGALRSPYAWGTYFQRLLNFGESGVNQLESMIAALKWTNNYRGAIVAHLSSPETDALRPLGAPCLQYIELCAQHDGSVDLFACYRSHDYFEKALGNFIGLSRLLNFLCRHASRKPGRLVCHSVYAFVGPSAPRRALKNLLSTGAV